MQWNEKCLVFCVTRDTLMRLKGKFCNDVEWFGMLGCSGQQNRN